MVSSVGQPESRPDGAIEISVVAPVYNEELNLKPLCEQLVAALEPLARPYELIFVDDGSSDGSFERLAELAASSTLVRVIQLRRNFGQTAVITAGIDLAVGRIIVLIDSDLQNDPMDIPRLIERLEDGSDVVSGWRKERKDPAFRSFLSRAANRLISWVTGVYLHDYGCTLKAYRAEVFEHLTLYGEMHRFIPAYLALVGSRIAELPVRHAARVHGRSNYGVLRTLKVVLDLLTVKFLGSYGTKPSYLFGGVGLGCLALGFVSMLAMIWQKFSMGVSMIQTPLLLLSAMFVLMGFQSLLMGLLSELIMRTYYESQGKRPYVVRRQLNS